MPVVSLPESLTAELRPAAPIVLAAAPTGVGKTHEVVHALARHGTRAVFATPTHDLAMQVASDLDALGVSTHYWRTGPTDEDACPNRDMVEFFRGLGYLIRWGPCRRCFKRKRCDYRRLFTSGVNRSAQVLILTSWHLRRDDLWTLKPLENRPLVVLDEDALSALTLRQRTVPIGVLEDQRRLSDMPTDVGSRLDRGRQRITVRNAENWGI